MVNLDSAWLDVNCPNCSYLCEVELIDIRTEVTHFCHNCKIEIKLHDENAYMNAGRKRMVRPVLTYYASVFYQIPHSFHLM